MDITEGDQSMMLSYRLHWKKIIHVFEKINCPVRSAKWCVVSAKRAPKDDYI